MSSKFFTTLFLAFLLSALFVSGTASAQKSGQTNAILLFQQGVALAKKGDYANAIGKLQKAVEANPKYYEAYFTLGLAFQNSQRDSEAADAFRRAIIIRPNAAEPHMLLGGLLQRANDADGAIDRQEVGQPIWRGFVHSGVRGSCASLAFAY